MPYLRTLVRQTAILHQYSKVDGGYGAKTGILPAVFAFLTLATGFSVFGEILNDFGIPPDMPFDEIPFRAEIKLSALGLLGVVLIAIGTILGMFMNAVVLLLIYKWKKDDVLDALIYSEYPDHWLKPQKELKEADRLISEARKQKKNFIVVNGVLAIGFPVFMFSSVIPALYSDDPLHFGILLALACLWLPFGALIGWLYWITLIGDK